MSEKRVNIKITASTSGFDSAIKKAQRQIEDLAKEIESLGSSKFGSTLEGQINDLVKALKEAEEQVDNVKKVLDDLDGTNLSKTEKGLEGIKDKMKDLTESGEKVVKSMDDIQDTLSKVDKSDLGGLDKSFTKVKSTVENLGKEMRDATDNVEKNFSNLAEGADKFSRKINDIDGLGIKKISNTFEDVVRDILKTEDAVDDLAKKFKDLDGNINMDSIQKFAKGDLTLAKDIMNDLVENGGDLKKILSDIDAKGLQGYKDSLYGGKYKSKDSWSDNSNKKNTNSIVEGFVSGTVAAKAMEHSIGGVADAMREATEGIREMPNSLQEAVSYFHNLNQEVADNKNKIDELNKSLSDSRKKYDDLNKEREEAKAYNDSFDSKEKELVDEYNKANDAMKKYKEQMADVNKWREKWNAQSKELREQMANVNKELAEQNKAYDENGARFNAAEDRCVELREEFEKLAKTYKELQAYTNSLDLDSMTEDDPEVIRLVNEFNRLEEAMENVKKQYKEASDTANALDDKGTEIWARIEALEQEKKALQELYNIRKQAAKDMTDRDGNPLKDTFASMNDELKKLEDQTDKARKAVEDFWDEFGEASVGNQAISQTSGAMMKKTKEEMQNLTDEIDKYKKAVSDAEKEAQGYADGFEKQYKAYETLSNKVKDYLQDEQKSILQREKVAKSFKDLADEMEKVYADSKKFSNTDLVNKTLDDAAEYIKKLDLTDTKNLQADLKRLGEIIDDKTEKIKRFKALNQEFGSADSWKAFELDQEAEGLKKFARTTDFVIEAVDELNKAFAQVRVGDDDNLRIRGRIELLENYGDVLARTAADIRNKYHDIEKAEDVYNAATPQERKELDKYEQWKKNRKEIEKYIKAIDEYRAAIKDMGGQVDSKFLDELGKFDARKFIEDFDKMGTSSAVLQKQMNAVKSELLENIKAEKENAEAMRQNAKAAADAAKTKLDQAKADRDAAQAAADYSKKLVQTATSMEQVSNATKQYKEDSKKLEEAIEQVAKAEQEYKDAKDNSDNYDKKRLERAQQLIKAYNEQAEAMRKMGLAAKDLGREDIEKFDRSLASLLDDAGAFGDDLPKSFADFKEDIKALFADLDSFKLDGIWDGLKEIGGGILSKIPTELKVAAAAALAFGTAMKKCAEIGINQFGRGMDTIKNGLSKFTSIARDVGQEVRDAFENITGMHLDASSLMEIPVQYEYIMQQVKGITGASEADFERLKEAARQWGGTTMYSATEVGEAMTYMGMAGWETQAVLDGIGGVLDAATIGCMDLGQASDFVTDGLTAMGLSAKKSNDFVDLLAGTIVNSNTGMSQLQKAYGNVGSLAGEHNVAISELNTALGLMANKGVKGAKAGTAMKNLFSFLAAPSDKSASIIKQYGLQEAQDMILKGDLLNGIKAIKAELNDLSPKEKDKVLSSVFGKEALPGMAALFSSTTDQIDELQFSIETSTKAGSEFAKSLGLIDKNGKMTAKTIGELKENNKDNYDKWVNFNNVLKATTDQMDAAGGTGDQLGAIIAKLGEDNKVTAENVSDVVTVFEKLGEGSNVVRDALEHVGAEFKTTDEGALDITATIKDLAVKWDTLTDSQKQYFAEQLGVSGSLEELNELFANNGDQIENLVDQYESATGAARTLAEMYEDTLKGSLDNLASSMEERLLQVFDKVGPGIRDVVDQISEFFDIWNNMGQSEENAGLSGLSDAFEYLVKASQGWGKSLESALSNAINSLNNFINDGAFDNMLQVGTNIINGICDGIKNAEGLESAITGAIDKVVNWVSNNMPAIIEAGGKIVDAICQGISDNGDAIGDIISQVLQMQTDIDAAISKEKWTIIGENLGTFITGGIEAKVKPFFSGFTGWLEGTFKGNTNPPKNMGLDLFGNPDKQMSLFDPKAWTVGSYESGVEVGKSFAQGTNAGMLESVANTGMSPIDIINNDLNAGKVNTDTTAASIGTGISDNIMAKLETMDASGLQALGLELQNLQTTVGTVATAMGTSFTQIQDASRVSFMGLANIINNQMINVANSIRTQMVNCANIFRNQFLSMANVARNQMVNVSNIVRNQAVSWSNVIRNQVTNARNALTSQFLSMAAVARTQMVNISNIVRNQATAWANIIRNQGNNAKAALTSSFSGMAAAAASGMAKVLSTVRSYMSQVVAATNRTMTMNFRVNRSITTTNTVRTVAAPAAASAMYAANAASTYSLRSGDASTLASRASSAISYSGSSGSVSSNNNDAITLEIPLILDGKEVARSTAKYVDGELKIKQKRDDRKRGVK